MGAIASATAVAFATACSPASPRRGGPCTTGFLGDASSPDLDFLIVHADNSVVPLHDGDRVPMIFPPQGGRVIFVGVRATNVDGCAVKLTGALRDEASRQVRFDTRTVNLVSTGDGWGASVAANASAAGAIASFANIPACPNQWSTTDVYGNKYRLEVTVKDRLGHELTKATEVVPECGEPDRLAECRCICKAGYVLGESCADAGPANADGGGAE